MVAVNSNFQSKLGPDVKSLLPINVDSEHTRPAEIIKAISDCYCSYDPIKHDQLRAKATARRMGRREKVETFMTFHRELRAEMAMAKVPEMDSEAATIRHIITGLDGHPEYGHFAKKYGVPQGHQPRSTR